MVEPVLKWAGGKRQILPQIVGSFPHVDEIAAYHEPFFGGGAIFFKETHPYAASINDINSRLMNFYEVVQSNPDELINRLSEFRGPKEEPQADKPYDDEENFYYQQREIFNKRPRGEDFDKVEEAALLLYLNRTCYNGLYRENSDGEFNVPIGDHSNPQWSHSHRILEASKALQGVKIFNRDFGYIVDEAEQDDLVYFDPPYQPVSKTSSFVEYSSEDFSREEQSRLRDVAVELADKGVHVVISNSPPIADLYEGLSAFSVKYLGARRAINSDASSRGEVMEILVSNVETPRERDSTLSEFPPQEAE